MMCKPVNQTISPQPNTHKAKFYISSSAPIYKLEVWVGFFLCPADYDSYNMPNIIRVKEGNN